MEWDKTITGTIQKLDIFIKSGLALTEYICHNGASDSAESVIPLVEIPIRVSTSGDSNLLFKGCNRSFHWGKLRSVSTSGITDSRKLSLHWDKE